MINLSANYFLKLFLIDEMETNRKKKKILFLKKIGQPGLFFVYFWSFQTNITIFTTNKCEKCQVHPVYGTGIRTHDLSITSLLP